MDVKHYLGIYKTRMEMQNSGITKPTPEIKKIVKIIVEKLSLLPLDEKIELDNGKMIDQKGNVIVTFPKSE